jgi:hypothetical protein
VTKQGIGVSQTTTCLRLATSDHKANTNLVAKPPIVSAGSDGSFLPLKLENEMRHEILTGSCAVLVDKSGVATFPNLRLAEIPSAYKHLVHTAALINHQPPPVLLV